MISREYYFCKEVNAVDLKVYSVLSFWNYNLPKYISACGLSGHALCLNKICLRITGAGSVMNRIIFIEYFEDPVAYNYYINSFRFGNPTLKVVPSCNSVEIVMLPSSMST